MSHAVRSLLHIGSSGIIVEAECHLSNGLPAIVIVGLGTRAIDEAKERIRSAYASCKLVLPTKRITINLAPADIPKDSTSFDLAIAASILQASGQTNHSFKDSEAVIGELGLDGQIRPVRGVVGKIIGGKSQGIDTFYLPQANLEQALLVPDVTVIPVKSLRDLYLHLAGTQPLTAHASGTGKVVAESDTNMQGLSFDDIVGQAAAKRALEIAAAGGHNILLSGPPGTGKSMLAKALPSILPPLSQNEMLEATHIHSLSSSNYDQLMRTRPFRHPHHSASSVSIVGGGSTVRPGEISLSHAGILFLDEMPEFDRDTIEALRQPLEDGVITIARARDSITYPASFMLVATANPCPCGYHGSHRPCSCSAAEILRYHKRISAPILDRIDLFVSAEAIDHRQLLTVNNEHSHTALRKRVIQARHIQAERFANPAMTNARMTNHHIRSLSAMDGAAKKLLDEAADRLQLSARAYMRTIKVARTIADLTSDPFIHVLHITEALQYRNHVTSVVE